MAASWWIAMKALRPTRALDCAPVAGPPEDVAGLGELPLRAWEVSRDRLHEAETRQHQPDAAPVVQTPAQLQRAFETGARLGQRARRELEIGPPDEHDGTARQVEGDVGDGLGQNGAEADVVAIEGHVDGAHGYVDALDLPEGLGQSSRQGDAARLQAQEDDAVEPLVVLGDLVGDAGDGPTQVLGVHDP